VPSFRVVWVAAQALLIGAGPGIVTFFYNAGKGVH